MDFDKAGFRFVDTLPILKVEDDNLNRLVFDSAMPGKTNRFHFRFKKP